MYNWTLGLHVAAGAVALFTYWVAGFARKGSPVHRKAGRCFMLSMLIIAVTAVPLAVVQIAVRDRPIFGLFLLYLLLLVLAGLYSAWYAIQRKRDFQRYSGPAYQALATALVASGAGVLVIGLVFDNALLWGFSLVGLIRGASMHWLARHPAAPRWWLGEHLGSMIGNGVAAHVAFLSIGLRALLPDLAPQAALVLAFYVPLGIGLLAAVWLVRRYLRTPPTTTVSRVARPA